jgi:ribonuclease HI
MTRRSMASPPRGDWDWQIVFDGGSLGNPGRGYGSYRLRARGQEWGPPIRLEYGDQVTNNEAEYRTLVAALEALVRQLPPQSGVKVEAIGDSQLVIRQVKGEWKVKAENLRPYIHAIHQLAALLGHVDYVWQRRNHSVDLLGH